VDHQEDARVKSNELDIEVYEEDGIFEASVFLPEAVEPYVRNPFATAKTAEAAIERVKAMALEIQTATQLALRKIKK
jgi:hypothetical protein